MGEKEEAMETALCSRRGVVSGWWGPRWGGESCRTGLSRCRIWRVFVRSMHFKKAQAGMDGWRREEALYPWTLNPVPYSPIPSTLRSGLTYEEHLHQAEDLPHPVRISVSTSVHFPVCGARAPGRRRRQVVPFAVSAVDETGVRVRLGHAARESGTRRVARPTVVRSGVWRARGRRGEGAGVWQKNERLCVTPLWGARSVKVPGLLLGVEPSTSRALTETEWRLALTRWASKAPARLCGVREGAKWTRALRNARARKHTHQTWRLLFTGIIITSSK